MSPRTIFTIGVWVFAFLGMTLVALAGWYTTPWGGWFAVAVYVCGAVAGVCASERER